MAADNSISFFWSSVGVAFLLSLLSILKGQTPLPFYMLHYYTAILLFCLSGATFARQLYIVKAKLGKASSKDVYSKDAIQSEIDQYYENTIANRLDISRSTAESFFVKHGEEASEECKDGSCRIGDGEGGKGYSDMAREGAGGITSWAKDIAEFDGTVEAEENYGA